MSAPTLTLKELKDRQEDGELDLSLSGLSELTLPIKEIKQLKKFHTLDLSCNMFKQLPAELCTFTQLTKLDVSKNMLTKLPDNIGQLSNLQSLDLLGNQLTTLPESFGDLSSLKWLDVRDNPLSAAILKEAGDCLDDRQCKTCALRVVKLMNYVHVEREKIRVAERAKAEAETQRVAEEEKQAKKRFKLEEKERKRQEFLQKQQAKNSASDSSHPSAAGDTEQKSSKDDLSESKDVGEGSDMCATLVTALLVTLIFMFGGLSLVLALYYYCQTSTEQNVLMNACASPYWEPVKDFIEDAVFPVVNLIQEKVTSIISSLD